jgi:UDP:flavonoid glycosyltransferase YjiC (YdhE family)
VNDPTVHPRRDLYALADGGGTVPPELGTVRRLVVRGHHVTVLAEDSMRADVRATGATFRPWTLAPNRASRHADDDPYRTGSARTRSRCSHDSASACSSDPHRRTRRMSPPRSRTSSPVSSSARSSPSAPWRLPLVALSTTFQDQTGCLQRVVDAVSTLPVYAVVTTGPAIDPDVITAPTNVTVVRDAPHSQILRHAAAVVTHGGHGTVVRALAAGVPLVILPHGRDQADNARRITARDAGVALSRRAKPPKIAAAVQRLLATPTYRAAAEQLGVAIRRGAESDDVVRELEALDATNGRPAERTSGSRPVSPVQSQ